MAATLKPRRKFDKLFLIEEAAVARLFGGQFIGAEIEAGRVALSFEMPSAAVDALTRFRTGAGPTGDLASFNDALRWSRDRIFDARRRGGLEAGR